MAGDSSSPGTVLGGIAAIILAIATLYGVMHSTNSSSKSEASPANDHPTPPKSSIEQTHETQISGVKEPNPQKTTGESMRPKPPFDPNGFWKGKTETGQPRIYQMSLDTFNGGTILHGTVTRMCEPGFMPADILPGSTWDGHEAIIKYGGGVKLDLRPTEEGAFEGTYNAFSTEPIVFVKGIVKCQ